MDFFFIGQIILIVILNIMIFMFCFQSFDIEILLGVEVTSLNTGEKTAKLSKGDDIKYDAVFLATGSE
jgi:NADPH-dependent 2,4-dienoyl-CoA reductase/sulfur reductase-like enzyme